MSGVKSKFFPLDGEGTSVYGISSCVQKINDILNQGCHHQPAGGSTQLSNPPPSFLMDEGMDEFSPFVFDVRLAEESQPETNISADLKADELRASECGRELHRMCAVFAHAHAGSLTAEVLVESVVKACKLSTSSSSADLQSQLYDLFGDEGFELMMFAIENADSLRALGTAPESWLSELLGGTGGVCCARAIPDEEDLNIPDVTTLSVNQLKKLEKKQQKFLEDMTYEHMLHPELGSGEGAFAPGQGQQVSQASRDWMLQAGFSEEYIERETALGLRGGAAPNLASTDTWLLNLEKSGTRQFHEKVGLPANTVRKHAPGLEEVFIPAPKRSELLQKTDDLVSVDSLTSRDGRSLAWVAAAFPGMPTLNRIQSTVFHAAFETSENMLICAPTGAGKTNIAMLALLQLVKQYIVSSGPAEESVDETVNDESEVPSLTPDSDAAGVTDDGDGPDSVPAKPTASKRAGGRRLKTRIEYADKDSMKAVYIAPMKALAQEVVAKFGERLRPLGLVVKEYTGDMQLTKAEVQEANVIVTTPEKWDVVTRKGGDGSLGTIVSLIIIDEVHLLADERGAVIETIVARTQRYIESSQRFVRMVGLSATLPNYKDVAVFLRVNPEKGLFHFGPEYRPVPLDQTFIGFTEKQRGRQKEVMNRSAYEKMMVALMHRKQVMIFVHSRKETVATLEAMRDLCSKNGALGMLQDYVVHHEQYGSFKRAVEKSKSSELQQFFALGMGMHNAGMLRADRGIVERAFECGLMRVLCCTATLAWGVNLPAHTVIIKGTEIYDAERGGFVDLSILDVMQIFGRAGRPQYDTAGHAMLLTAHDKLNNYLSLMAHQSPMESTFIKALPDHLNAEIVNGTITNIKEASSWLSYTFLYIRMRKNPILYGMKYDELFEDPGLVAKRHQLVHDAAVLLDQAMMIRYDHKGVSGNLAVTDLGRVASHYYIKHQTIVAFNSMLRAHMADEEALHVLCSSSEFDQLKVRPEEVSEIEKLRLDASIQIKATADDTPGKVNTLLQAYINRSRINSFTLQSDSNYVAQNAARIARALFEICLKRGWSSMAAHFLDLCKALDRRMLPHHTPLRQFLDAAGAGGQAGGISFDMVKRLEDHRVGVDQLLDYSAQELSQLLRVNQDVAKKVISLSRKLPMLGVAATIQPITRGVLRVKLVLTAQFEWSDACHGTAAEPFWIWVEDANNEYIYHSENFLLNKRQRFEQHEMVFTIPVIEPLPPQYYVRITSDRWVGCSDLIPVSFQHLLLPQTYSPNTDLFNLHPVPVAALHDPVYEALYSHRFSHFNPIQSQIFHALYHTDVNVLVGAPTGSGKTITSEIAVLRMLNNHRASGTRDRGKVVYIAPLKALARERLNDWRGKFGPKSLGLSVLELSGDVTPDIQALNRADIIIATPEKWDGITRGWQNRSYVRSVELVIIDEIHLLGEERGPVLEVIVSRMRYMSTNFTKRPIRFVGLSTALANANDLGDWLGITPAGKVRAGGGPAMGSASSSGVMGLYNFRPSVRPVPMVIHIQGFPGKHYCPRMATMNKPCYANILEHSPEKPVLIFVSSRRQTRLTALDLISYCACDDNPKRFLHMPEEDAALLARDLKDSALRDTLVFGIGIHHAGLDPHDRAVVEELFVNNKIQVLVCTSTLAWGVNFPAHLVIVKGTEFFDGKTCRYVDFPVTDVLQMMGRAGRPQFDDSGVACILVHEPKKMFYKKFLHEPFPVESSLHKQLHNHINAEVANGAIRNGLADCVEFLTWTYFFRRLTMNPSYYQLTDTSTSGMALYVQELMQGVLLDLQRVQCVSVIRKDNDPAGAFNAGAFELFPTAYGIICARYYIDYKTIGVFLKGMEILCAARLDGAQTTGSKGGKGTKGQKSRSYADVGASIALTTVLRLVLSAMEFSELPVRHNEELLNEELAQTCAWGMYLERGHVDAQFMPLSATGVSDWGSAEGPVLDSFECAHVKAYLLVQAKMQRLELPIMDYINDTKTVMDQLPRVLSCFMDMCVAFGAAGGGGMLNVYLACVHLGQLVAQAQAPGDSELLQCGILRPQCQGRGGVVLDRLRKKHSITSLQDLVLFLAGLESWGMAPVRKTPAELSVALDTVGLKPDRKAGTGSIAEQLCTWVETKLQIPIVSEVKCVLKPTLVSATKHPVAAVLASPSLPDVAEAPAPNALPTKKGKVESFAAIQQQERAAKAAAEKEARKKRFFHVSLEESPESSAPPVNVADEVRANHNCEVSVRISKLMLGGGGGGVPSRGAASSGWTMIVCHPATNAIYTTKRFSVQDVARRGGGVTVSFNLPPGCGGREVGELSLFFVSEAYAGPRVTSTVKIETAT